MNTSSQNSKKFTILLCLIALTTMSCIDQRYDLNKGISKKISIGGDSLSIPLASTDSIKIGSLINADSIAMLMQDSSGYKINMSDSLSVDIPTVDPSLLSIEDMHFGIDTSIAFVDADNISFSIPGIKKSISIDMGANDLSVETFEVPNVTLNKLYEADMSGMRLSNAQKNIQIDPITAQQANFLGAASLPFGTPSVHIAIPLTLPGLALNFGAAMEFGINVPNQISKVYDMVLASDPNPATCQISLSLDGANDLFTSGEINQNIRISVGDLFVFENNSDIQDGDLLFVGSLNKDNQFTQTKTFNLQALNINKAPEGGLINISDSVKVTGTADVNQLTCYADELDRVKALGFKVEVRINGMLIESMNFEVNSNSTGSSISGYSAFNISSELDEHIAYIDSILLEQPSEIIFDLATQNLNGLSDNIQIDTFKLIFPDEFILAPMSGFDPSTNTYTLQDRSLGESGLRIAFNVIGFNLSSHAIENNVISWNDEISYTGSYSIGGRISSNNLPTGNSSGLQITIGSNLQVDYATIRTNDMVIDLPQTVSPINFDFNISNQIKELGTVTVEDGSYLRIRFNLPDLPLNLLGDLQIKFPDLIKFAGNPANLDDHNVYTITGAIPDEIALEIEAVKIERELNNGYLSLSDSVKVSGSMRLEGGIANSDVLMEKIKENASVEVVLDRLVISDFDVVLTGINANFSENIAFQTSIDIPDLIKSIDSITINDSAALSISIGVNNLPDIDVVLDFIVNLPTMFMLEGENLENNIWRFRDTLRNENDINEVIHIKGLSLANRKLGGTLDINEDITCSICLYADDPSISSSDISSEPIEVFADISLSHVKVEGVYGVVDPQIDPICQSISIGEGLPDMLKDTSVILDINPIIALDAQTNIGIPIEIEGLLIPVVDGERVIERQQRLSLSIAKSPSAQTILNNKFWMAKDRAGMPDDYQFVSLNMSDIFSSIPDSIVFEVVAGTDPSVQHEFLLDESYLFNLKYDVTVPLSFGEKFKLSLKDTIDLDLSLNTDSMMIELGEYVEIFGSITNSIPLNLKVSLTPIDSEGDVIDYPYEISQSIEAGKSDGSASISPLSIKISNKDQALSRLNGFIIDFSVTSNATIAGTPIRPENFVKADLKLRTVGGIIIDLDKE